jgi:hypothetical protein
MDACWWGIWWGSIKEVSMRSRLRRGFTLIESPLQLLVPAVGAHLAEMIFTAGRAAWARAQRQAARARRDGEPVPPSAFLARRLERRLGRRP